MNSAVTKLVAILLVLPIPLLGTGTIAAAQDVTAAQTELTPSAAVGQLLREAQGTVEGHPQDSLTGAEKALAEARSIHDRIGEALAQQARAKALLNLHRPEEALSAWQQAAQIWSGIGDTPEQIRALAQAGLLCLQRNDSLAEKLFAQGLALGTGETERPAAVAQSLHESGVALDHRAADETTWNYLSAALAIWEKQAPKSLKLVETLNALAKITITRATRNAGAQYYYLAGDYSKRAAEMCHRLAPDSPLEVDSLHVLGRAEYQLEDFDHGEQHFLGALQIQRKLEPEGSLEEASILR
jgi:tetratricopeptide (TPR) repeat protein